MSLVSLILLGALTVTSYRPVTSQTDSSPTYTSIGDRTTKFGVAVSQDLLKSGAVHYGDTLYIPGFGLRVVNDCMNARITKSIDLLVLTRKEERRIGTRHLLIYVVKIRENRNGKRNPL